MLDYAAFPQQRQSLIRQKLREEGRVVCADLSRELDVSEHTIRRDLQELAREGICKRVYGGAVSIIEESDSFINRVRDDNPEKSALGAGCAALVKSGSCIFIDSGSTNLAIARHLPDHLPLTLVTNSPQIAVELMNYPLCEVIILGGRVQKLTGGSLGVTPQAQIEKIWFDQCFLGACAMDPDIGLTVFDYEDAEFKRALVQRSNEIIVALTADKMPGVARYAVASCDDISTLVAVKALAEAKVSVFAGKKINIELV